MHIIQRRVQECGNLLTFMVVLIPYLQSNGEDSVIHLAQMEHTVTPWLDNAELLIGICH